MTEAAAWAVIDGDSGRPIAATVSAERRGAIVNWLFIYGGITPLNSWTDARIEAEWSARRRHARVAEVVIVAKQ
jgi:hypothetical protein